MIFAGFWLYQNDRLGFETYLCIGGSRTGFLAGLRPLRALESSVEFEFCSLLNGDSAVLEFMPYPEDFTLANRGFLFLGNRGLFSVAFVFLCLDTFSEDDLSVMFVFLCLDLFNDGNLSETFVFLCLDVFSDGNLVGNLVLDAAGLCLRVIFEES